MQAKWKLSMIQEPILATAFLSCSLRPEDRQFIEFIERI